jgi:N-methylhydantoinase B
MKTHTSSERLDPVTFEVLRNALITIVDQMAEQVMRTCYSFVVYNRDFSNSLLDAHGNTVAQGHQDLSAHVGTLHYKCKAVIDEFTGDINPGDIFLINDPYVGGTHFSDTSVLVPIFHEGQLIAWSQANGHWADMGGSVPGSFDISATDMFKEGIRIPPIKIWREDKECIDVIRLIAKNTRDPDSIIGDMAAQTQAAILAKKEVLRLCEKYSGDTIRSAFEEVQDYLERAVRKRLLALPNGSWETVDFIDQDPSSGEGLIPIKVKLTIKDDQVEFDFTGSHATIGTIYNSAFGATFSAVVSGMKTFFPELPLNAGLYRIISVIAPENSIVNAKWPIAVTGFVMPFEKIMNAIFELFSKLMPERALACSFNIEYLQTGGYDARDKASPFFMYYDWLSGGWGGRNGRDGLGVTAACFGVGLMIQAVEGQERLYPVRTDSLEILTDSAGPGEWRGGMGIEKKATILDVNNCVMSYICDRERAVVWGIEGGLPAQPQGLSLTLPEQNEIFLGTVFSNYPVEKNTMFRRHTSGGGGYGDPLKRKPERVLDDVIDDYVSVERAAKDYGVVLKIVDIDLAEYSIDVEETKNMRDRLRKNRKKWLDEDPKNVASELRLGKIDVLDAVRQYGVICNWETGELLEKTTSDFREQMKNRTVRHWN